MRTVKAYGAINATDPLVPLTIVRREKGYLRVGDVSRMHTDGIGLSRCGHVFECISVEDGDVAASVEFDDAGAGESGEASAQGFRRRAQIGSNFLLRHRQPHRGQAVSHAAGQIQQVGRDAGADIAGGDGGQ